MKKTDAKQTVEAKPEVKPITTLAEIIGLLETPVKARFQLDERMCELEVKRAMPAIIERRREIHRAVTPPFVKERNDYDTLNPQYMARRDLALQQARAITIYQCCPQVAAAKPGLNSPEEITRFIGSILPEAIQELIELTALAGGLDAEVASRANFT